MQPSHTPGRSIAGAVGRLYAQPARLRRLLVRRPWIYWVLLALVAGAATADVHRRLAAVDAARQRWGTATTVWIASSDADPGSPIAAEPARVPAAIVPPSALRQISPGTIAIREVAIGEIVTDLDVAHGEQPLALAPAGWLVVPVVETPPSGAHAGEAVVAVSDGVTLTDQALVVGTHGEATLIAVPAAAAALVPAAANNSAVTLLRNASVGRPGTTGVP